MKISTHNIKPFSQLNKKEITAFLILFVLLGLIFLIPICCAALIDGEYLQASLGSFASFALLCFIIVMLLDMEKAYIEIDSDRIRVVDYFFLIKKEKIYFFSDIAKVHDSSRMLFVPGYCLRGRYFYNNYYIFRDKNNKYLFKVIVCEKSKKAFESLLSI